MGQLRTVPVSMIHENVVALRSVNRQAESYIGLVESIRQRGFFGAITVREKSKDGKVFYEIVDGLHRYSAAKDAGLADINVDVMDLDDASVLEAQILANIHRVETQPFQYSQQLRRILALNPLMTEAELATRLGKSSQWLRERLGLAKIVNKNIANLIDEGQSVLLMLMLLLVCRKRSKRIGLTVQ